MTDDRADPTGADATAMPAPGIRPLDSEEIEALRLGIVDALHTVYDPEIPVDIYELGLIYDVDIDTAGNVAIRMTLTAPGCPVAGTMPDMVKDAVSGVGSVGKVEVELVWEPPWDKSRMSETAQLALGMI